jgi:hypothetical protein
MCRANERGATFLLFSLGWVLFGNRQSASARLFGCHLSGHFGRRRDHPVAASAVRRSLGLAFVWLGV